MNKKIKISFILLTTLFLGLGNVFGQEGPGQGPEFMGPPEVQRPELPDLPVELRGQIDLYQDEKESLRNELRETLAILEDPTRDEIRESVQAFREENAERIASQHELAAEIREELKEIRGDRPLPPHRRPLPPELEVRRDEFLAERQALQQERQEFFESIKDLTGEERDAAIQAFREEQRQRLQEQKELRRDLREQIREGVTDTGNGNGG